ncbi:MAG: valine--tRNA ligase [Spirochaetaceae bacterium]|nr:MAG: valine--tRNA ligase [Spirochaetaceae bacterium]
MQAVELAKSFDPNEFEDRIYEMWQTGGYFSPREGGEPFVVVIPPPNVTGVLHLGHGLNNSLQDLVVRYQRMRGKSTLWVPGTDHAGIATQSVVERMLADEGVAREQIGRDAFIERTWQVANDHRKTIVKQLKKIGSSCDWSRERFTLDDGLSAAVRDVFVSLYEEGLVYRGLYMVNWSVGAQSAVSDDEVEFKEVTGRLTHIDYPLDDGSGAIRVATTRPETMLGDTAVAVHPDDERYRSYVGKSVRLPLTDRVIPIIADEYVDREFGTGAVKITPAHDPNDYEIGKRHDLQIINILNKDGTLNANVPEPYQGLTTAVARKRVVADLKTCGAFVRDEEHVHQVGHCYRTGVAIEPYLSEQWFVRMKPLADEALSAWQSGDVIFYPRRWENTYRNWLEGIRDWCISRQLWWGHRIPVWYNDATGEVRCLREDPAPEELVENGGQWRQDPDVLDTWFSSWLWPFTVMGWPEQTEDLAKYYPTSALVTAYDIIFFWVARMIMAGMHFTGKSPFRDVYITSLVRDIQGRKMSKSLGNGIDPLEIVQEYGADALKFTLAFMAAQGQDVLIDKGSFGLGSRFGNKIWNAARYLLMNLAGRTLLPLSSIDLAPIDQWIFHRLNETVKGVDAAMAAYRFNDAAQLSYEFFWNDFCDWYIEASKLGLYSDDDSRKDRAVTLLVRILEESLRLLHPFMSFITEEIYQKLPDIPEADRAEAIIVAPYPAADPSREALDAAVAFAAVQELIRLVRTLRSEFTIPPSQRVRFVVECEPGFAHTDFFAGQRELIEMLTTAERTEYATAASDTAGSVTLVGNGFRVFVFVRDAIDADAEIAKIEKNLAKTEALLAQAERKLGNAGFLSNASQEVVAKERAKRDEFAGVVSKLREYLARLR